MEDRDEPSKDDAPIFMGVPKDLFSDFVQVVQSFVDRQEAMIFLGREMAISIKVFHPFQATFQQQMAEVYKRLDLSQYPLAPKAVTTEIEQAIVSLVMEDNLEKAVRRFAWTIASQDLDEEEHAGQVKDWQGKLELVIPLATETLRERARRLRSATAAVLEEVDYEIVESRNDTGNGIWITSPFLRLRVRNSKMSDASRLTRLLTGEAAASSQEPFEVECGLMDLDLLVNRIKEARESLAKRIENEGKRHA